MITLLHWLSSCVVLSVCLAHVESLSITSIRTGVRFIGWALIGLAAFGGIFRPLINAPFPSDNFGMIGLAVLAVSYGWQGATRHVRHR